MWRVTEQNTNQYITKRLILVIYIVKYGVCELMYHSVFELVQLFTLAYLYHQAKFA